MLDRDSDPEKAGAKESLKWRENRKAGPQKSGGAVKRQHRKGGRRKAGAQKIGSTEEEEHRKAGAQKMQWERKKVGAQ